MDRRRIIEFLILTIIFSIVLFWVLPNRSFSPAQSGFYITIGQAMFMAATLTWLIRFPAKK